MPKSLIQALSLAAVGLIIASASVQADDLPALVIDKSQVSVSGLSSGAYMAGQMHVAYSGTFTRGAGIVAGGPFDCAEGQLYQAVNRCIAGKDSPLSLRYIDPKAVADRLTARTNQYALTGDIDPTRNLAQGKVWLFTGGRSDTGIHDTTVNWRLTDALKEYYLKYLPEDNIYYKNDLRAEHAMPTDSFGNACPVKGDPYINQCGFDTAGAILNWLHGPLNPRNDGDLSGTLVAFDQSPYLAAPTTHGMNGTGWAYVPAACAQGRTCKLHVVFHGCKQYPAYTGFTGAGAQTFGETYVRNAGYNRWADSNDMVVLYPQGHDSPRNPRGCWDWWGYDDADYATRKGRQMAAVKGMVDRLAGGGTAIAPPPPADGTGAEGSASKVDFSAPSR